MFFYASKIIWFFLTPSNLLPAITLVGVFLLFTRFRKMGRRLAVLGAVSVFLGGLSPLGSWLLLPLEQRFAKPDPMPPNVGAIVLLGGFADTREGRTIETADFNEASDRFFATLELARLYPNAKIVLSGGGARFRDAGIAEADFMKAAMVRAGFSGDRLIIESRSRNTDENAQFSRELIDHEEGVTLLVTSAFHMPRSVGVFRKAGWIDFVPFPVDFRSVGDADKVRWFSSVSAGLRRVDLAVKEWIGLLAYWITGRSDELFPSPGSASR